MTKFVQWSRSPEGEWNRGIEYDVPDIQHVPVPAYNKGWEYTTLSVDFEQEQGINEAALEDFYQDARAMMATPEYWAAMAEYEAEEVINEAWERFGD